MEIKSITYSTKAKRQLNKRTRKWQKSIDAKNIKYSNEKYGNFGVFGVIVLVLAIIVIAQSLTGSTAPFTFQSLLDIASNAPSISANWSIVQDIILGDWGIFNFLRDFINFSISITQVLVCICDLLFDSLSYIFYFVRSLLFF
jgi:purine-cytosine permease-like protein